MDPKINLKSLLAVTLSLSLQISASQIFLNESPQLTAQNILNINQLASGYNIYLGNPLSDSQKDPGETASAIAELKYSHQSTTSDGKWSIPDKYSVKNEVICQLNYLPIKLSSETEVRQLLKANLEAEYSKFPDCFSGEPLFKQMKAEMSSGNKLYFIGVSQCSMFNMDLESFTAPDFNPQFVEAAKQCKDVQCFSQLFDTYGTHYITGMEMGQRQIFIATLSKDAYAKIQTQLQPQSITVEQAISFAAQIKFNQVQALTESQKTVVSSVLSPEPTFDIKWYQDGALPDSPKGTSLEQWAQQTTVPPVALKHRIAPISRLFEAIFTDVSDIPKTVKMADAYNNYYTYLKSKGTVAAELLV